MGLQEKASGGFAASHLTAIPAPDNHSPEADKLPKPAGSGAAAGLFGELRM